MHLFHKPFSPKPAAARKASPNSTQQLQLDASQRALEFGLDYNNAYMNLNDIFIEFDPLSGRWRAGILINL
jgi:hypothetical protein